jgi:hypothetical protein
MSKGFSRVFIDAEGIHPSFEEMSDALIGSFAEPLSSLFKRP